MPQSSSAQRFRDSSPSPHSESSGVNGVKLAAVMMLVGAAWSFAQRLVLSHWVVLEPAGYEEVSIAAGQLVLAVALFQGSEEARKFVLWVSGLAALVIVVALPLMGTELRLWLVGGAALLGA